MGSTLSYEDNQRSRGHNKARNVTPTSESLSNPTNMPGSHITGLSKTFDLTDENMSGKKNGLKNTSIMNSSADSIKTKNQ